MKKQPMKQAAVRVAPRHSRLAAPAAPKQPQAEYALNPQVLKLATLASKEDSRFTLAGIYIDKAHAVVTDGHMLAKVDLHKVNLDSVPAIRGMKIAREWKPFILPAGMCADALKAIPKKTTMPILSNAFVGEGDENHVEIGVTDLERPKVLAERKPTGTFPDYNRVVPQTKPDYEIVVDAKLLKRVLDYAIAFHDNPATMAPVKLGFWKHEVNPNVQGGLISKAFTVDADCADTRQHLAAVVMPMKGPISQSKAFVDAPKQEFGAGPIVPAKPAKNGRPAPAAPPAPPPSAVPPRFTPAPAKQAPKPQASAPAVKSSPKTMCPADDPRYAGMTAQQRAWITIRHNRNAHHSGEDKICPLCPQSASAQSTQTSAALRRRK